MDAVVAAAIGKIDAASLVVVLCMGIIGERAFSALHPQDNKPLKDRLYETAFAGLASAVFAFPLLLLFGRIASPDAYYWGFVFVVAAVPAIGAVAIHQVLALLVRAGLVLDPNATAWDAVFLSRKSLWVVVHLKDGRRIGGIYGTNSYASLHPQSGHLYLEEIWELDAKGAFLRAVPQSAGALFRPDDYDIIEFYS